MMERRRALMWAKSGENHLLFERKNLTVETGDQIATGVQPFISGRSVTILVDFTNTANPTATNAVASKWKLIRMYSSALSLYPLVIGKSSETAAYQKLWWYEELLAGTTMDSYLGVSKNIRRRLVITHNADENAVNVKMKNGTNNVKTVIRAKTYQADNTELTFGGPADGPHSLPSGTFSTIQVWDKILSDDEINAFFA